MKEEIFILLEKKGIRVSEEDQDIIIKDWEIITSQKEKLDQNLLNNYSTALRFFPGGNI